MKNVVCQEQMFDEVADEVMLTTVFSYIVMDWIYDYSNICCMLQKNIFIHGLKALICSYILM